MNKLQTLFNRLNDSAWVWWPLVPPPSDTPMRLAFYANCLLYRGILPWILCMTALLGGLYMPGFLLTHTFAATVNTALTWAGFWITLFGFLYLPHLFFWNRRAWILLHQQEAESPFQPVQTPDNSTFFNLQGKPIFTHPVWTHTLTKKQRLSFPTLLGYGTLATLYAACFTLLLAPALLSAVAQDLEGVYPSLSSVPQELQTFPETEEDLQRWDKGKHRICCLGGPLGEQVVASTAPETPENSVLPGNYMLEVPWSLVDVREMNDFVSVCSRHGQCVFFQKRKADTHRWLSVNQLSDNMDQLAVQYRAPYPGEDIPLSEFDAILNSKPDMLTPQTPLWKAVPLVNRLLHKLYLMENKSRIYRIQTAAITGFQLGDPARDRWVSVIAFDPKEQGFSLNFGRHHAAEEAFSQSQIRRILETLQPKSIEDSREYAVMATKRIQNAKVRVP